MRPLPTSPEPAPSATEPTPRTLELGTSATSNQRRGAYASQKAYPWLLAGSTGLAAVFCFLYLSKPVIITEGRTSGARATASLAPMVQPPALSGQDVKTGTPDFSADEPVSRPNPAEPRDLAAKGESTFEETNLRIQHVLGAMGPSEEDLGRLVLEVPVLFQSGSLRWTREDVVKARSLMVRLDDYQERSRELRGQAEELIQEWDNLIYSSIPESALRADSPSLPENQGVGTARDAVLNTTDSIQIENR